MDKSSEKRIIQQKRIFGNQLQTIESVPFILLMDWELMKIPYQPFSLIMKIKRKNHGEHYSESYWEKKSGMVEELNEAMKTIPGDHT